MVTQYISFGNIQYNSWYVLYTHRSDLTPHLGMRLGGPTESDTRRLRACYQAYRRALQPA